MKMHFPVEKGMYMNSDSERFRDYFKSNLKNKTFLDLGAGYGDIVDLALSCGANAHGIEWEKSLINGSLQKQPNLIMQGDLFDANFNQYDFLFYFLGSADGREIELKEKLADYKGMLIINTETCPANWLPIFINGLNCDYKTF